tara:strand:- start:408 stop:938 length:531 start_codon:yes stop_codon:yes gene_type:complete
MEIKYTLQANDYLAYYLHHALNNKRIQKRIKISQYVLAISFAIISCVSYMGTNMFLTIYLGVFSLTTLLFYPKYFKWKYKKYYKRYIKENHQDILGKEHTIKFTDEFILAENFLGENKIKVSAIDEVFELPLCFLVKVTNTSSFIIPKEFVPNQDDLRSTFKELGFKITDHKDWSA